MNRPHSRTRRADCLPALPKAASACLRASAACRAAGVARRRTDALGRKTQETLTLGSQSIVLKTGYAATGKKSSQAWPDSSTVTYTWDDAQRLTDLQIPGAGNLSTSTFDTWNQPQSLLYPGGSARTQDYDGFARLSKIRLKSPSQTELMNRGYSYDNESNITGITTEQGDNHYQYDALYRLTTVSTGISGLPNEQYSYDSLGNRLTDKRRPNPSRSDNAWRYNGNNQLTESATEDTGILISNSKTVSHTFDANGSLIQKATPAGTEAQYPTDNQKYVYDAANRLSEVQDQIGNKIASYQYDPLGRRIRKTLTRSWDGSAWTALTQVQTLTYVYADEGLAAEYKTEGSNAPQLTSEYGWKPDGMWGTDPVWIKTIKQGATQAEFFFYQNDHLGTPQKIIDSQGTIVWSMKATAFGETQVDQSSTITNNLRFPGQYYDSETNTHYNYFRDYSPQGGRYVQSDPIGMMAGANYYAYVDGRPGHRSDSFGLFGEDNLAPEHNDMPGGRKVGGEFNFNLEDDDWKTAPDRPWLGMISGAHFQPYGQSAQQVADAINTCNRDKYQRSMHRLQDFYSHYNKGYRAFGGRCGLGHMRLPGESDPGCSRGPLDGNGYKTYNQKNPNDPDNDQKAWDQAAEDTARWNERYYANCKRDCQ